jgi:AcrR family transcriptional regulator
MSRPQAQRTGKPRRRYQMRGRRAGAQATREAIARAAIGLFVERGFARTTIEAIAAAADVAPQTVYAVYGSKAAIAGELTSQLGREVDIGAVFQSILVEDDPHRQVEKIVALDRYIAEQHGDLYELIANTKDSELATLREELDAAKRSGMERIVERLQAKNALRPGLSSARAVDILCALPLIHLYRQLVTNSGWTPDEFESWVAGVVKAAILAQE